MSRSFDCTGILKEPFSRLPPPFEGGEHGPAGDLRFQALQFVVFKHFAFRLRFDRLTVFVYFFFFFVSFYFAAHRHRTSSLPFRHALCLLSQRRRSGLDSFHVFISRQRSSLHCSVQPHFFLFARMREEGRSLRREFFPLR